MAIVSYSLWQHHYGGSPAAIGEPLVLEGKPYTVVGIAPAGFRLSDVEPDVLTLIGQDTSLVMRLRDAHPGIEVWARLRPGATQAEAQTELALMGLRLAAEYPKTNAGRGFVAQPLRHEVVDQLAGDAGPLSNPACAVASTKFPPPLFKKNSSGPPKLQM